MRIALGVEYDGHEFYGWQSQDDLLTVQSCLENALNKVANEYIQIFCAGRTDAGVHAIGQVIHFDTQAERDQRAWTMGTRMHLPASISIRWAQTVDDNFHARYRASSRRYRYIIYNNIQRPAILAKHVTHYFRPLDVTRMQDAVIDLVGEHDFTSFRSSQCQSKTAIRQMHSISVTRQGDFVVVELQANAFLHHMVRNILGVLLRIGSGQLEVKSLNTILQAKDRRLAYETAPAAGLYLTEVAYPKPYDFPKTPASMLFY